MVIVIMRVHCRLDSGVVRGQHELLVSPSVPYFNLPSSPRRYRAALRRSLAKLRQALQRQRKTSRPQSTALHLEVVTSRSKTSVAGPPSQNESMTPQAGPGDTRVTSHPDADRECPAPHPCHIVEVNEDRDTEGSEDRAGARDSTTLPHSPTVGIPGHNDTDRGSAHTQDCPTAEEHTVDSNTDRDFP